MEVLDQIRENMKISTNMVKTINDTSDTGTSTNSNYFSSSNSTSMNNMDIELLFDISLFNIDISLKKSFTQQISNLMVDNNLYLNFQNHVYRRIYHAIATNVKNSTSIGNTDLQKLLSHCVYCSTCMHTSILMIKSITYIIYDFSNPIKSIHPHTPGERNPNLEIQLNKQLSVCCYTLSQLISKVLSPDNVDANTNNQVNMQNVQNANGQISKLSRLTDIQDYLIQLIGICTYIYICINTYPIHVLFSDTAYIAPLVDITINAPIIRNKILTILSNVIKLTF